MQYLFRVNSGVLHVYSLPHFCEVYKTVLRYWRSHVYGNSLFLTNAGFYRISIMNLDTMAGEPHYLLPHRLGEYYTLLWLDRYTFLSLGRKSWLVSMQTRQMTKLWKDSQIVHFHFGSALFRNETAFLVGGVCADTAGSGSEDEFSENACIEDFDGIVEIALDSFARRYHHKVLPRSLLSPAVICLSSGDLLIFGSRPPTARAPKEVSMDAFLFDRRLESVSKCGSLPGPPTAVHSAQCCGYRLFAMLEDGDAVECNLINGIAVRFNPVKWGERKKFLWLARRSRLTEALIRLIVCEFLAT